MMFVAFQNNGEEDKNCFKTDERLEAKYKTVEKARVVKLLGFGSQE